MEDAIQNFFFLIFYSNPIRSVVHIYIDGDEHQVILTHDRFIDLITTLAGYENISHIHEAISTYGNLWLYDRENNKISRLEARGGEDIKTIQGEIQASLKRETTPEQNPINPAEHLALTPPTINITTNMRNPYDKNNDSESSAISVPSITIKRKI